MSPLPRALLLTAAISLLAAPLFAHDSGKKHKGKGGRHKITLARFDRDGDGKLNEDEFNAAVKRIRHHSKAHSHKQHRHKADVGSEDRAARHRPPEGDRDA